MLQTEHPGSTLNNVGISGDTSDDLINKQLTPAINFLNGAPAGNLKIALVWIGSNDLFGLYNYVCDQEYGNNYSACEAAVFGYYSTNVDAILNSLAATEAQIYIALLDDQSKRPVMADSVLRGYSFDAISDEDVQRMSAQVVAYNQEIARLAAVHGATTVDFFNTTIFVDSATLSEDGNHPNGNGYDAIANIWFQVVSGGEVVVPDSDRWIFHVTSFTGGFLTRLFFLNAGASSAAFTLQPRSRSGQAFDPASVTVDPGNSLEMVSTDLFGSDEVSHFSITAPESGIVTVGYRVAQGQGASAHVNETTLTGRRFLIYPGEQDVVFDGLALINLGAGASEITLTLLDASGQELVSNTLDSALGPKEKLLATLDGLPMTGVASVSAPKRNGRMSSRASFRTTGRSLSPSISRTSSVSVA